MKTLLCFIVLSVMVVAGSQRDFYTEKWKVNETKTVNNVVITRLNGENTGFGVTNIVYKTQKYLLREIKARKSSGDMSKSRWASYDEKYRRQASGGMLHVFLTRNDFDMGNMDYFHVKIIDRNGKEIFKKQYPNQIPRTYRKPEYMWKNEGRMLIGCELFLPITIEVTDKSQEKEVKHSFKISAE